MPVSKGCRRRSMFSTPFETCPFRILPEFGFREYCRPLVNNKLSNSRAWFWPWRCLVTEESMIHLSVKSPSRQLGFAGSYPDPICSEAGFTARWIGFVNAGRLSGLIPLGCLAIDPVLRILLRSTFRWCPSSNSCLLSNTG